MDNDSKSLEAISKFRDLICYKSKNGQFVELMVETYKNETPIHEERTECGIAENYKFGNIEIIINWKLSNSDMLKNGLHSKYNTKFQDFEFDGKKLIIKCGDGLRLSLWKLI